MITLKKSLRANSRAFSLVEVMVASAIVAVGLTAVYVLGSQCAQISVATYRASLANQTLQERMERLKGANFPALLSSGSLSALLAAGPSTSATNMGNVTGLSETVAVSSYLVSGSAATSGTIAVANAIASSGTQSVSVLSSGTLSASTSTARIQVTLGWMEKSGSHSRSQTLLISRYD
jgi:prepilin-type N-terminal cleavage/methylation domain-containing protein